MACERGWKDVYLTHDDSKHEENYTHDEFLCPVMSCQLFPVFDNRTLAMPIGGNAAGADQDASSEWLMPAALTLNGVLPNFTFALRAVDSGWNTLKVGDMIRAGTASHGGFTDYLTVLEVKTVDFLKSKNDWQWFPEQSANLNYIAGDPNSAVIPGSVLAVRVNYSINCSTLPETARPMATIASLADLSAFAITTPTDKNRLDCLVHSDTLPLEERRYYACYRQKRNHAVSTKIPNPTKLTIPLEVRTISGIKLMGYSLVHGAAAGLHHQHEGADDDWYALRFKEIEGDVLSNNRAANRSFHVINARDRDGTHVGSSVQHSFDVNGLACKTFPARNLSSLTVELVDLNGQPARFGRLHLWLRVQTNS